MAKLSWWICFSPIAELICGGQLLARFDFFVFYFTKSFNTHDFLYTSTSVLGRF